MRARAVPSATQAAQIVHGYLTVKRPRRWNMAPLNLPPGTSTQAQAREDRDEPGEADASGPPRGPCARGEAPCSDAGIIGGLERPTVGKIPARPRMPADWSDPRTRGAQKPPGERPRLARRDRIHAVPFLTSPPHRPRGVSRLSAFPMP